MIELRSIWLFLLILDPCSTLIAFFQLNLLVFSFDQLEESNYGLGRSSRCVHIWVPKIHHIHSVLYASGTVISYLSLVPNHAIHPIFHNMIILSHGQLDKTFNLFLVWDSCHCRQLTLCVEVWIEEKWKESFTVFSSFFVLF